MTRRLLAWVTVVVLVAVASCGGDEGEEAAPVPAVEDQAAAVTERDVVYATWEEGSLTLDMHIPAQPAGAPVVIHVPGRGGDDTPRQMVKDLVDEGAIVFVVQYPHVRVSSWDDPGKVFLGDHGAGVRAMAEGVACAIRFARAQALGLGSDDPIVVLSGFSLGGGVATHVALCGASLEARWDEYAAEGGPPRQVDCEVTEGSTHVDALVGMAGAYDIFVPVYDGSGGWGREYQQELDRELWEFLSSSIGVNPDLRIRLLHGESDPGPTYEESAEFAVMLTDGGHNVEEVVAFEGGHWVPAELAVSAIMESVGQ